MALLIYVSLWLFGEKDELTAEFFLKLALMALIILVLILATGAIAGALDNLIGISINGLTFSQLIGLQQMLPVLAYLLSVYAIQHLLVPYRDWKKAVWITFVAFCGFYGFNALVAAITSGDIQLIMLFG